MNQGEAAAAGVISMDVSNVEEDGGEGGGGGKGALVSSRPRTALIDLTAGDMNVENDAVAAPAHYNDHKIVPSKAVWVSNGHDNRHVVVTIPLSLIDRWTVSHLAPYY